MPSVNSSRGLSVKSANRFALFGIILVSLLPSALHAVPLPQTWHIIFAYAIAVILALYFCRKEGVSLAEAFDFRRVKPLTLLLAVVIFAAIQPVMALLGSLTNLIFPNFLEMIDSSLYGGSLFVNLVGIALIPGFFEEFLIRGGLVGSYRRTGRLRAAILLSSLIFGLMHGNVTQLFYAMGAGIVLASLYILSGSIWPGILLHFLNNGSSVVEAYIKQRFGEEVSKQVFYFSTLGVSFSALLFSLAGIVIIVFSLRAIAKLEGNEDKLGPCIKGGGTGRLVTRAFIVLVIFLILLTIILSGAIFLKAKGYVPANG